MVAPKSGQWGSQGPTPDQSIKGRGGVGLIWGCSGVDQARYRGALSLTHTHTHTAPTCSTPALLSFSCFPLTVSCLCNICWASTGRQLRSIINRWDRSTALHAVITAHVVAGWQELSLGVYIRGSSYCFRWGGRFYIIWESLLIDYSYYGVKNICTFSTYSNISMLFSQGLPIKAAQRRKRSAPCSLMSLFPACCCGDGGAPSAVSRCLLLVRQRESSVSYYVIPTCTSVTCRQMFTLCCQSVSSPSWLSGVITQEIKLRESSQKNKQDLM